MISLRSAPVRHLTTGLVHPLPRPSSRRVVPAPQVPERLREVGQHHFNHARSHGGRRGVIHVIRKLQTHDRLLRPEPPTGFEHLEYSLEPFYVGAKGSRSMASAPANGRFIPRRTHVPHPDLVPGLVVADLGHVRPHRPAARLHEFSSAVREPPRAQSLVRHRSRSPRARPRTPTVIVSFLLSVLCPCLNALTIASSIARRTTQTARPQEYPRSAAAMRLTDSRDRGTVVESSSRPLGCAGCDCSCAMREPSPVYATTRRRPGPFEGDAYWKLPIASDDVSWISKILFSFVIANTRNKSAARSPARPQLPDLPHPVVHRDPNCPRAADEGDRRWQS